MLLKRQSWQPLARLFVTGVLFLEHLVAKRHWESTGK